MSRQATLPSTQPTLPPPTDPNIPMIRQFAFPPPTRIQMVAANAFSKAFKQRVGHPHCFVGKFALQLLIAVEKGVQGNPRFDPPRPRAEDDPHEPQMVLVDYPPAPAAPHAAQQKEHLTTRDGVLAADPKHFVALNNSETQLLYVSEPELTNLRHDDIEACFKADDETWDRSATIHHTTVRNEGETKAPWVPRNLDPARAAILYLDDGKDISIPILDPSYLVVYIIMNRIKEPLQGQLPYLFDYLVRHKKHANLRGYVALGANASQWELVDLVASADRDRKLNGIYHHVAGLRRSLEQAGKGDIIEQLRAIMDKTDTEALVQHAAGFGIMW